MNIYLTTSVIDSALVAQVKFSGSYWIPSLMYPSGNICIIPKYKERALLCEFKSNSIHEFIEMNKSVFEGLLDELPSKPEDLYIHVLNRFGSNKITFVASYQPLIDLVIS